jgi:hypothetical protein
MTAAPTGPSVKETRDEFEAAAESASPAVVDGP